MLDEAVDPRRMAWLIYDMQEAIFAQVPVSAGGDPRVVEVPACASEAGVRIFFCRHMTRPRELMGAQALRTAMAWQRIDGPEDVRSLFLRDSPGFALVPEVAPLPSEAVCDKLGMSMFAGTPLDTALRDCGVSMFAIAGVVLEIGIAPTISHATDLGYVPIVVANACGIGGGGESAGNGRHRPLDHVARHRHRDLLRPAAVGNEGRCSDGVVGRARRLERARSSRQSSAGPFAVGRPAIPATAAGRPVVSTPPTLRRAQARATVVHTALSQSYQRVSQPRADAAGHFGKRADDRTDRHAAWQGPAR